MPTDLDLDAYLRRIGWAGSLAPDMATLQRLASHHAAAVPFENLSPLLGLPVSLDLGSLQAKLVMAGRGGYCFEQNTLFAEVLRRAGFTVTRLAARALPGRRLALLDRDFAVHPLHGDTERRTLAGVDEAIEVLQHDFGIVVPHEKALRERLAKLWPT